MIADDGSVQTAHSTNVVPLVLIGEKGVGLKESGRLADLAPTMLDIMGLEIPKEMTGTSLLVK
jgi:2,3-bisphosphoglycerate-independent phosphoglycerate mutase